MELAFEIFSRMYVYHHFHNWASYFQPMVIILSKQRWHMTQIDDVFFWHLMDCIELFTFLYEVYDLLLHGHLSPKIDTSF